MMKRTVAWTAFATLGAAVVPSIVYADASAPTFEPTEETMKTAPLFLQPTERALPNVKKVGGGVLGLDIGILDLGLLSASQIHQIDEKNRHSFTVPKGEVWEYTAAVSIHSVLGGHAFNVHVFKKDAQGHFVKQQTYSESSGAFLGIAKEAHLPLEPFTEGEYEVILELGAGLSVVQVVPFTLKHGTAYNFTNVATDRSRVRGNVLNGQHLGEGQDGFVSSVGVKGQPMRGTNAEETIVQGAYGHLVLRQDGTYEYVPASVRENVGEVETFVFTIQNRQNGKTVEGELVIRLDEPSVLWDDDVFDAPGRVVEARPHVHTVEALPMTHAMRVDHQKKVKETRLNRRDFKTPSFYVKDTATTIDFAILANKGANAFETDVHIMKQDGTIVRTIPNVAVKPHRANALSVSGLPRGHYNVYVPKRPNWKGTVFIEGLKTGKATNPYAVRDILWGTYDQGDLKPVEGAFAHIPGNFFSKDSTKTDIFVEGYHVETDPKTNERIVVADEKAMHRLDEHRVIAGEYGYLVVEADGSYVYEPFQDISSYGQRDTFRYTLRHLSGKTSEATLSFELAKMTETTTNDDVIVSTRDDDTFVGKGGSDTLVYAVLEEDDARGGNGHDTWVDFTYGTIVTEREADRVDLRRLFTVKQPILQEGNVVGYRDVAHTMNRHNVRHFVRAERNGNDVTIWIDRDGPKSQFAFEPLLTLSIDNAIDTNVPLNVQTMIENGQLIVPWKEER